MLKLCLTCLGDGAVEEDPVRGFAGRVRPGKERMRKAGRNWELSLQLGTEGEKTEV